MKRHTSRKVPLHGADAEGLWPDGDHRRLATSRTMAANCRNTPSPISIVPTGYAFDRFWTIT
jgi:hypothetical protein